MNTPVNKPPGSGTPVKPAGGQPVSQPTPATPPDQTKTQPAPSPRTAEAPMHTSVPEGQPTGPGTATSTHTDTPVTTTGPTTALPMQEADVSQGHPAKTGASGHTTHPVTGGQTNEYVLNGSEILEHSSHKFGIDTKRGVTELRWDEANQRMIVRHSPPPPTAAGE